MASKRKPFVSKWNLLFWTGTLLLFVPCSPCSALEKPDQAGLLVEQTPVIFCAEPFFDFGILEAGEDARHRFTLENHGTAPLLIEKTKAG